MIIDIVATVRVCSLRSVEHPDVTTSFGGIQQV